MMADTNTYWCAGPQWPGRDGVVHVPVQPEDPGRVPLEVSAEAWKEYAAQGHGDQSHERIIQRGGFGSLELAILLFQRIKRLESRGGSMTEVPTPNIDNTVADRLSAANALFPTPAPADNQVERSLSDDDRRVVAEVRLLALQLHDKLSRLPGGVTDEINSAKGKLREAMHWALRHVHLEQRPPV
jgi:hypothetical protein